MRKTAAAAEHRRRPIVRLAWLIAALLLVAGNAAAQDPAAFYKGKTLHLIVGFSPGGGYDVYARLLARYYGRYIPGNPTIIVQNMPGAASLKSVQFLDIGSVADGLTITTFNPGLITQSLTTPDKVPVKFLDYAWIGNISEDVRVCFTWHETGIKSFQDLLKADKIVYGNTGVGTSAYTDDRMLSEIFGVKLRMVQGYPGSADKRIAIEQRELDGDCGSWTSLPEDWLRDAKINLILRFSQRLVPGLPPSVPYAGDLLTDPKKQQIFALLAAPALIGRPYIAPKSVPADRLAALKTAFDATMKDAEFVAEAGKEHLLVTPMTGAEVEQQLKGIYQAPRAVIEAAKVISGD
jgi:tripartite-type tricarboxylate transporter receptor subunit TctC